jgi:hypothetical protein
MITRSYHFSESTYEYDVLDVETKEDGKKFIVDSFTMDWYNGKTNIPVVPRKEKETKQQWRL